MFGISWAEFFVILLVGILVIPVRMWPDVARFVAKELATIDSVTSTATHFVMRRYKEMDVQLISPLDDDRGQLWV